jgi:hypothetical protein
VTHHDRQDQDVVIVVPTSADAVGAPPIPTEIPADPVGTGATTSAGARLYTCSFCQQVTSQWHRRPRPALRRPRRTESGRPRHGAHPPPRSPTRVL